MTKKILILDDDIDFNNLLTSIFSKAKKNYQITSCQDPKDAIKLIEKNSIDLVVTDQRMPNLTGFEFAQVLKKAKPSLPIIMVSGFLDSETIRQLINIGVDGIFLKPLNVFSLLERTAQLLNQKSDKKNKNYFAERTPFPYTTDLTFPLQTFPCNDPSTKQLANLMYYNREFQTNLVFIGPNGSPFLSLAKDLSKFIENQSSLFLYFAKTAITLDIVENLIKSSLTEDHKSITILLPVLDDEGKNDVTAIAQILKEKNNLIPRKEVSVRFIFCLQKSADILLAHNFINEELYLNMGNTEIEIPALRECTQDIEPLTEKLLEDICKLRNRTTKPSFSPDALTFLKEYSWPRNYEELYTLIDNIVSNPELTSISSNDIKSLLSTNFQEHLVIEQESDLIDLHSEYIQAIYTLTNNNIEKSALILSIDQATLKKIL